MTPRHTRQPTAQETPPSDPRSQLEAREIARTIANARKRAGMTQVQVAEAMGIAQSAVAKLESGRVLPRLSTVQRFARATASHLTLSLDPVSAHECTKASHSMTDTLTRPSTLPHSLANRRHFLGGTVGLAGLLGLGNIHHVTAQEATAAASASTGFVWTPPDWEDETRPFAVLDRTSEAVLIETVDGQFEVPADPQRLVMLESVYVHLIQLGITNRYVAAAVNLNTGEFFGVGGQEDAIRDGLGDAVKLPEYWEPNIEELMSLNPDLMIGYQWDPEVRELLVQVAPFIQSANVAPRATLRAFSELFGREAEAETLITRYDERAAAARELLAPILANKKVAIIEVTPVEGMIWPLLSYSLADDSYFEPGKLKSGGIVSVVYRDLHATPSSFVESVADSAGREMYRVEISEELVDQIDADYIFIATRAQDPESEEVQAFLNNPLIQATSAARQGQVFLIESSPWESDLIYQEWLLEQIVEALTGQPFA